MNVLVSQHWRIITSDIRALVRGGDTLLKFRLVARLDVRGPNLIKPVNLEGVRVVGDPQQYAERYDREGIDEIYYNDAVASLYGRNGLADLVARTSGGVFCPLTVGGGVKSIADVRGLLLAGADKVAVNTAAIRRPELITEIAEKFGSQCMVLQIDAKRRGDGSYEAYIEGGRQPTGKDAIAWAEEGVRRGAGEILLTSIDQEGTRRGIDVPLLQRTCRAVRVPVVYSGGVGSAQHVLDAAQAGASGVAMAHCLHYQIVSLRDMRLRLAEGGVPVRMAA